MFAFSCSEYLLFIVVNVSEAQLGFTCVSDSWITFFHDGTDDT